MKERKERTEGRWKIDDKKTNMNEGRKGGRKNRGRIKGDEGRNKRDDEWFMIRFSVSNSVSNSVGRKDGEGRKEGTKWKMEG